MLKLLAPLLLLSAGASVASFRAGGEGAATVSRDTGDTIIYVVRRGETLGAIAQRHFIEPSDWRKARALNQVADADALPVGARLRLDTGWLKRTPETAEVVAFRGAVTATIGGRAAGARLGLRLAEGDRIETGTVGFVTLRFPDGSEVSLPTNSAVTLQRLRRYTLNDALDRRLAVDHGGTRSRVEPLRDPTSRYEVTTPVGVAAVRGTDFRVRFTPDAGRGLLTVLEGRVGAFVVAEAPEALVPAGAGLVMDPAGLGQILALPAAPDALDIPVLVDAPVATLSVEADPAFTYRALLATDPDMRDQVAEAESTDGVFRFERLGAGTYFLEVAAITTEGLEGIPARFRFEQRLHHADVQPGGPGEQESVRPEASRQEEVSPAAAMQVLPAPQTPLAAASDAATSFVAGFVGPADGEEEGDSSQDAPAAGGGGNAPAAWSALSGPSAPGSAGSERGLGGWSGSAIRASNPFRPIDQEGPAPSPVPPLGGGNGGPVLVPPPIVPPAPPPSVVVPLPLPLLPDPEDGSSGVVLVPGATIPEPSTWALLIVGFGLVGLALRRRSRPRRTGLP